MGGHGLGGVGGLGGDIGGRRGIHTRLRVCGRQRVCGRRDVQGRHRHQRRKVLDHRRVRLPTRPLGATRTGRVERGERAAAGADQAGDQLGSALGRAVGQRTAHEGGRAGGDAGQHRHGLGQFGGLDLVPVIGPGRRLFLGGCGSGAEQLAPVCELFLGQPLQLHGEVQAGQHGGAGAGQRPAGDRAGAALGRPGDHGQAGARAAVQQPSQL